VRRNRAVELIVDPAVGWTINDPDAVLGGVVQAEPFSDANGQIVVDPNPPGTVKLTYTGLGLYAGVNNPDVGNTPAIRSIRITHATLAAPHDLRVAVDPGFGVGVRVCDKRFATTDPVGCPAGLP